MIFLDVTGACLLPLQSGIPRTTRGLWPLLRDNARAVRPICWQPFRRTYTRLSKRSRILLENPLSLLPAGSPPRDSTLPLLWSNLRDVPAWPEAIRLRRIIRADDVLFLTSIFPDNRLGYLQRLASGPGRKVAIFHDAIPLRDPNVARWERARHLATLRLLASFDQIIAVSEAARRELLVLWHEHKIPATRVAALAWPVPFTGARLAFSPPRSDVVRILYVSRLKAVKNHAVLFAVCDELWAEGFRFELELIGCEDEARESRAILRELRSLQRKGRAISWRAYVSEEELHAAYRNASFTVFPSLMEGFGLPIVESLWHGRGVICGADGATGELAAQGGCLAVDVHDAAALTAALRHLIQDHEVCRRLAVEAYTRPIRTWADYGRELLPMLGAP